MIGKLTGTVDAIGEDELVLDVAGVGYLVMAGAHTLARLQPGMPVTLHIETYVREDVFRLFGFLEELERAWFVRVQSVQGVGAKHALALLDAATPTELETAAALGDASTFERAKGIGAKLATRMATELKGKAPPLGRRLASLAGESLAALVGDGKPATPVAAPATSGAREGAVSALINLGYSESEARQAAAIASRNLGDAATEGGLIKAALRELAR